MSINPSGTNFSSSFSPSAVEKRKALEKKRKLVENKMLLWLAVPVLWIIPLVLAFSIDSRGLFIFGIAWIFIVLFGLGGYIMVALPSKEEISREFKKIVIPDLIRMAGAEGDYSQSHGLKVDAFLKANLYHEEYSHFERADSIVGKYKGEQFGLYELAVQQGKTFGGGMGMGIGVMAQSSVMTNHFYGWVLHVPIRRLSGNTYIIPTKKKANDEADDWVKPTLQYFGRQTDSQFFQTGDRTFDSTFFVYTTNVSQTEKILHPKFREFLVYVFNQSGNAPGFSFVETRAYMHLGISDTAFDRQDGTIIYPPDVDRILNKIRFFCEMVSVLSAASEGR